MSFYRFAILAPAALLTACAASNAPLNRAVPVASAQSADALYVNGDILTMVGNDPAYVGALAVADGRIIYAGPRASAPAAAKTVDLGGKTLLPGFIDTHGHMVYFGKNLVDADLVGTPDIPDLLNRMKAQAARTPPGGWIVGFGYSVPKMKEGRAPTVEELAADIAKRDAEVLRYIGTGPGNGRIVYRRRPPTHCPVAPIGVLGFFTCRVHGDVEIDRESLAAFVRDTLTDTPGVTRTFWTHRVLE